MSLVAADLRLSKGRRKRKEWKPDPMSLDEMPGRCSYTCLTRVGSTVRGFEHLRESWSICSYRKVPPLAAHANRFCFRVIHTQKRVLYYRKPGGTNAN